MVVPEFATYFGGVLCRLLGIITRVGIYYETGSNDGYSDGREMSEPRECQTLFAG